MPSLPYSNSNLWIWPFLAYWSSYEHWSKIDLLKLLMIESVRSHLCYLCHFKIYQTSLACCWHFRDVNRLKICLTHESFPPYTSDTTGLPSWTMELLLIAFSYFWFSLIFVQNNLCCPFGWVWWTKLSVFEYVFCIVILCPITPCDLLQEWWSHSH